MKVIYQIRLLGSIRIEKEGVPIRDFESRKTLALLGYLARQEQPTSRSQLAGLLWGDKPEASGRRNLSRELSHLSSHLPNCFQADYHTIQFQPTAACWVDTLAFKELVKVEAVPQVSNKPVGALPAGQSPLSMADPADTPEVTNTQISNLAEAVALYQGDFMTGFYLDGCPEFETWLLREQEAWRRQITGILDCLTVYHGLRHQYNEAQFYVKRWLELEPWQEEAHRYMMILLARMGKRGDALVQYETCRRTLVEELAVEPEAETTALCEQIRTGAWEGERAVEISTLLETPRTPLPNLPPCPYRGLFSFREADAPFFFGREAFTAQLVEAVHRQPLTVVIGPSGSGKSSIVFAGLLPHLRREEGWLIAAFRPDSHPFYELANALIPLLEPNLKETDRLVETGKLAEALSGGGLALSTVVARILEKNPGADQLLLLIDPFEELYSLCPEPRLRHRFLDVLLESSTAPPAPLHLVLTLRADFVGQALAYRPFVDALVGADVKLGPMTRQELGQAIEKPAEKQGVTFEAGLVDRILDNVGDGLGNLPLLEFTLSTLWERQAAGQLTHAAYEAIGQVVGSLGFYAEDVCAGLSHMEQEQTRRIFMQLIRPGQQTADIRRRVSRAELNEEQWSLAQRLADARLVMTDQDPTGQETVEIVHEALIRGWSRLQAWLNEDRAFRIWHERLRAALSQWEASNRDEAALLHGVLLVEAEERVTTNLAEITPPEHEFLQTSLAWQDQRVLAREAQLERELGQHLELAQEQQRRVESEHQRAEAQVKATRQLRWLAAGLAVMFLLAVGVILQGMV